MLHTLHFWDWNLFVFVKLFLLRPQFLFTIWIVDRKVEILNNIISITIDLLVKIWVLIKGTPNKIVKRALCSQNFYKMAVIFFLIPVQVWFSFNQCILWFFSAFFRRSCYLFLGVVTIGKNLKKIINMCFHKIHWSKKDLDLYWYSQKSYSHFIKILWAKDTFDSYWGVPFKWMSR